MGVHTGDSITIAPALTLTDKEYQELRNASVSDWADWIRKLRRSNMKLLRMLFENPLNRLAGDEWIVDCLDLVLQGIQPSETSVTFERKINEGRVDSEGKSIEETFTSDVKCKALTQTTKFDFLLDQEKV